MATTTSDSVQPSTVNGKEVVAPQETVVTAPKQTEGNMVEIELFNQFVNNYTQPEADKLGLKLDMDGRVTYGPGKVKVDRATADDLLRRQQAVMASEHDRLNGADRTKGEIAHLG